jgi:hypothetical protein
MKKLTNPQKIDFILLDSTSIEIKEDSDGFFFMIGDYRANFPPQFGKRKFIDQDFLSFFIDKLSSVGIGVISCYLYDLLKTQLIKNVNINGKSVNNEEEIKKALEEDG